MFNLFEKMQELVNNGYDVSINADHKHPSFPFSIRIDKNDAHASRDFDLIDSSDISIGIDQMIEDIDCMLKEVNNG